MHFTTGRLCFHSHVSVHGELPPGLWSQVLSLVSGPRPFQWGTPYSCHWSCPRSYWWGEYPARIGGPPWQDRWCPPARIGVPHPPARIGVPMSRTNGVPQPGQGYPEWVFATQWTVRLLRSCRSFLLKILYLMGQSITNQNLWMSKSLKLLLDSWKSPKLPQSYSQ